MTLEARERELYETVWALPAYATYAPGEGYVSAFFDMATRLPRPLRPGDTVLDAGAGTGKGAIALAAQKLKVEVADLTPEGLIQEARGFRFHQVCLWDDLVGKFGYRWGGKMDWVYCCDVLEHIPTAFTMLVIARLLAVSRYGLFLSISLSQDSFGPFIGQPLHQTVQSFVAWREQLGALGDVIECRDLIHSGLYLVRPR